MDTSNHSSRPGYSRVYNITPAGSRLARYLDYVDTLPTVSPDIMFADSSVPPEDPGDQEWDDTPRAHIQTPEETAWAIQQLMDAGATFPNFQVPPAPPAEYGDDERQPLIDHEDDTYERQPHWPDPIWNPNITPWHDVPPADDPDDDYGAHSPEED